MISGEVGRLLKDPLLILAMLVIIYRGVNDASRVRVQLNSSLVVNISSRARTRVELT